MSSRFCAIGSDRPSVMRDHSLLWSMLDRHERLLHILGYVDGPLRTLIGAIARSPRPWPPSLAR